MNDKTMQDRGMTLRWKIDKDLELYRFYLDMSVKAAVFLMTVTGALASYILANPRGEVTRLALVFPALMNAGFAVLFFYSISESKRIYRLHIETSKELGVEHESVEVRGPNLFIDVWRCCGWSSLACGIPPVGSTGTWWVRGVERVPGVPGSDRSKQ